MMDPATLPAALACDMTAIPPADREAQQRVARPLVVSANDIQESPGGFSFQLSADDYEAALAAFLASERASYITTLSPG